MRSVRILAAKEFQVLRRDLPAFLVLVAMPVVVMAFVKPTFRAALTNQGFHGVNGAEQAVPGIAVMFAFFLVGTVGLSFFREHGWHTWPRLLAAPVSPVELMAGKAIPLLVVALTQQAVLFGVGGMLFGLHVRGSLLALALVAVTYSLTLVAFGLAAVALSSSFQQINLVQTVGAMFFAGLGGALTPMGLLPGWVEGIGHVSPAFWALAGYRSVVLLDGGLGDVAGPCGVLLVFAAVFGVVAARRFRSGDHRVAWA